MRAVIGFALLGVLLSACIRVSNPVASDYSGQRANIADTMQRQTDSRVYFFSVSMVNGTNIETSAMRTYGMNFGRVFTLVPVVVNRDVPAQPLKLMLQGVIYRATGILYFAGSDYVVEGNITFTPEPNRWYKVNGQIGDRYAAVWLEDEAGNIVSDKVESRD